MQRKIILTLLTMVMVGQTCANRMISVKSSGDFYAKIRSRVSNQLTLTAVLFYNGAIGEFSSKQTRDRTKAERKQLRAQRVQYKKLIGRQREAFGQAGKAVGEVGFLAIDVSKKAVAQLQHAYHLKHFPVVLLFKNGSLLVTKEQKTITLQGDFSTSHLLHVDQIVAFVQRYLGKEIKTIIKAKAQAEFELAKARASAPQVYAPYWGWGWGGWGSPYGWGYGGGWCGWGRCW